MVEAFDGRLNISLKLMLDRLEVRQLADTGFARTSVAPQIQFLAMNTFAEEARNILSSGVW